MNDDQFDDYLRVRIGNLIERAPEPRDWPSDELALVQADRRVRDSEGWIPPALGRSMLIAVSVLALLGGFLFIARYDRFWSGGATSNVSSVAGEVVSADGRLYFLPAMELDLSLGVDASIGPTVDEGTAVVVGRVTETGFDGLGVVMRLTSGPTFGTGEPVTIAGRALSQARYENGGVAEQLPDGSWLEYLSGTDAQALSEMVAATTFENGSIEFEETPSGIRSLVTIGDVSGQRLTRLSYPNPNPGEDIEAPPALWFTILTTGADHPDEVLLYGALLGSPLERITIRGQPGYLSVDSTGEEGVTAVFWYSPTGHAVAVFSSLTPDEAISFANSLRSLEETTWRAELGL